MSTFLALVWREIAMLAVLTLVGSGIACWPRDLAPVVRLALAPALGLAISSCLLMTLSKLVSMRVAAWVVLVPVAIVSTVYAVRRVRAAGHGFVPRADVLRILVVVAVVLGTLNVPLASRDSFGPVGYMQSDAAGYVSVIAGLENHPMRGDEWGPDWNLMLQFAAGYSSQLQHIGENHFPAAANALFGFDPQSSQSAATFVFILVAALGAFAACYALVPGPNVAVLCGVLFAGPVFLALFSNGSMATLAGQTMVVPFGLFAQRAFARGDWRDIVVLGLLAAGVQTLFGSVVPGTVIASVLVLGGAALFALRSHRLDGPVLKRALLGLGAVAGLAIVLSPVSFIRDVGLWRSLASGNDYVPLLPYDLPIQVLGGWLLGTREFFALTRTTDTSLAAWVQQDVLPLCLLALMGVTLLRNPRLAIFAALFAGSAAIAFYSATSRDCAYCVERNLAAVAPVVILVLAATVGMVRELPWTWSRAASVALAALILLAVGNSASIVARRIAYATSMLPGDARAVADAAKGREGPLLLEGLEMTEEAIMEAPSVYQLLATTTDAQLALDAEGPKRGLTYLPLPPDLPSAATWTPAYRHVFTRLPSIATDRRLIERHGAYALQERTAPFDVTVAKGVWVDRAKRDRVANAYLNGPLDFRISALRPEAAWLRITIDGPGTAAIGIPRGVVVERRAGEQLDLCTAIPGRTADRRVTVPLAFVPPAPQPSGVPYEDGSKPSPGPRLARMVASPDPCRR